ncbi:conserved Plasmodium protein, unknown function [Plasmodium relictum]|uniref:C2H2-type domain-containing protein n=1 Tax=Plasmodium relictum TaxID=85471 RepID=A0A1J1H8J7_PLARL|nr:conserved Plasmodium protein, unknown function [Plasmodium relictum]CRH01235.1 conserved Plasmodium protein, unknown function [Plasmodium relictum]
MKEATETVEKKRKRTDNIDEPKEASKLKKKIEFENDDEYEKYLLNNFKKNDEKEYVFSEFVKIFYNEIKKYKTVDEMANEIKKLAFQNISRNLEIICNNECTSSFFIEKFRVKYINEQNILNIKSSQNNFKEFMILYNNNNHFNDFGLEINTNIESKSEEQNEHIEEQENENKEKKNKDEISNILTKDNFYKTHIWKEKIKCKIENINDNNILTKIVNYLTSISLHFDHIPIKLTKFDIIKKLNDLNYDIMNINIWDTYNIKETRSSDFFRKANVYFKNQNKTNEILNLIRENPSSIEVNGYFLNDIRRNNYNYLDLRICPPICSHIERIKIDYENAKKLIRKLDKSCEINLYLLENLKQDRFLFEKLKKRKILNNNYVNENNEMNIEEKNEKTEIEINDNDKNRENNNSTNIENSLDDKKVNLLNNNDSDESPIIQIVEENKDMDITKKLDILILYLRFVHNFCYYSARKYNTYDEMVRECGYFYLRVNLDKSFFSNLIPIFYENYNIKKLECYVNESILEEFSNSKSEIEEKNLSSFNSKKMHDNLNYLRNENSKEEKSDNNILQNMKKKFNDELVSDYQLKWLINFDEEINDALKANYNQNIDIEKTKEFFSILKKNYILKTNNNQNEIRCAKCKKLFHNIKDVPNHIFTKHNQIKMKLITETEVEIMKRVFFESPHSFHFFYMMERKFNSNSRNYLNKNFYKRNKNYKNENFHLIPNNAKNDYKDFDEPNLPVFENLKHDAKKKNDFYDDT